jgi:hypothetical protein
MTVEHTADIDRKSYVAGAGQAAFGFPIKVPGPDSLEVWVNGVSKLEGVHWSATGYGLSTGVTLTFDTPLVGGETVLIKLNLPYVQDTDYTTGGPFTAESHEAALDYQHNLIRQTRALVGRGLRFSDTASSVHDDVTIPAMTGNAGEFLRVNAGATGLEWSATAPGGGGGGDPGVTLPIDAQDVNLTEPYTGAFNIGLDRAAKRLLAITPYDFSATQLLRDGSYNAQPYFQAMMDSAFLGEGTPQMVRGSWRWDSEVVADYRGKSTTSSNRGFDIIGEGGEGGCVITYSGIIGLHVVTTPGTANWHTFASIGGFRMINSPAHSGSAIYLSGAAYIHLHHMSIYNAAWGVDGVDVLSSTIEELYITGGLYGIRLQIGTSSRPNALTIMNNTIGAWNYGCLLVQPSTVKFLGNTWEGIGKLGADVNRFAVEIQGAGTIGGGISFDTEHFEGTHGLCDIRINAGTAACTYSVSNCTMQKTLPAQFPVNNIRIDQDSGDGDVYLRVEGTKFSSHNGYVPDANNLAIRFFSANGNFWLSEDNNYYQNTLEMPNQACNEVFAHALVNGALAGPIAPLQQHNIGPVTKVGTGHYTLPFRRAGRFPNKVATATLVGVAPGQIRVTNYSSLSVTVRIWSDFAMTTPVDATFAVICMD